MIEVDRIKKSFVAGRGRRRTEVNAVDTISFGAEDGAITALLGPNGAGKTTTLRIIATLVRPDRGTARVGGVEVALEPRRVRASLGVLSDARGLYTRLTGRENIAYYARLQGIDDRVFEQRLGELSEVLDLNPLLARRTAGFSTGERMKIALARALIHDPQHLILDEPTAGLDVMATRALRGLLQRLRGRGKCIVFSTHVMQEVEALSDTIVVVAHGRVVAQGTAAGLAERTAAGSLEDAFVALAHGPTAPMAQT
jgi:sodium transport system ATP-binding protein